MAGSRFELGVVRIPVPGTGIATTGVQICVYVSALMSVQMSVPMFLWPACVPVCGGYVGPDVYKYAFLPMYTNTPLCRCKQIRLSADVYKYAFLPMYTNTPLCQCKQIRLYADVYTYAFMPMYTNTPLYGAGHGLPCTHVCKRIGYAYL